MQKLTASQIVEAIKEHTRKSGAKYWSEWYAGITSDIDQRLHGDHKVPEKDFWYIWREAISSQAARDAEAELLKLGYKGGSGGGDDDSTFVYAYKITSITRE
jgi:hypothetical protein